MTSYEKAQNGMRYLMSAVYEILAEHPEGITNAEIGKRLGIYSGHIRHEGHVSRTILSLLETQGVAKQDSDSKTWKLAHG